MTAARFLVSGKVQGVFYRASTRAQALALGLDGHALNWPDGRVDVVVAGPEEAIARLASWLWQGPPQARVTAVERLPWATAVPPGFRIG